MLETQATVVSIESEGRALVEADQVGGCGQCNGKSCGTAKLSRLFCSRPRQFQVDNPIRASVGDQVIVSVSDGSVLRGISLIYVMPLVLLLMGAALGEMFASNQLEQRDSYAAIGAILGILLGFVLNKFLSRLSVSSFRPHISRLTLKE